MAESTISKRQNTQDNLNLLAAQRHLYSVAKSLSNWSFFLAVVSAIAFPLMKSIFPEMAQYIGLAGGLLFLITSIWIKGRSGKKAEIAAKIQEKFDVDVLDLAETQHEILGAGPKPEDIKNANKAFSGNRKNLENWYSDTKNAPKEFSALISQRSNLVWDWRQRKFYSEFLTIVIFGVLIISVVIGIWKELLLLDYLSFIFSPILSLLWLGSNNILKHKKVYEIQSLKEDEINGVLKRHIYQKEPISSDYLRSVQNTIFKNRKESALVPDFIYSLKKEQREDEMKLIVENYIKDLQKNA